VRLRYFILVCVAVAALVLLIARMVDNEYGYFAGYVVLHFIVLATAWNILGGYCGYVNFGSAGFFAIGVYSSVALHTFAGDIDDMVPEFLAGPLNLIFPLPLPALIVIGGVFAGLELPRRMGRSRRARAAADGR
jgi:branched-chain amino acid transport system permease protein